MDKFSNFFLMLKQGIKGVFHFRVQFLIILILSFIATFILSVSLSTQRRMNNSYDQIVKKVPRFDFQGNIQLKASADGGGDAFLITNLLDNADYLSLEDYETDLDGNQVLSNPDKAYTYNYVFADRSGAYTNHHNFFTVLTSNPAFQNLFIQANLYQSPTIAGLETTSDVDGWYQVYQALFIELFSELTTLSQGGDLKNNTLPYSVVGRYTVKYPNWFSPYLTYDDTNQIIGWNAELDPQTISVDEGAIFNNVQTALIKIITWMKQAVDVFLMAPLTATEQAQITFSDVFAFLFGIKLTNTSALLNDAWLVDPDNPDNPAYDICVSNQNNTPLNKFVFVNNDPTNPNLTTALHTSGFKGILNPIIYTKRANTTAISFSELSPLNFFTGLLLAASGQSLFDQISVFDNFHQVYNFTQALIKTAFVIQADDGYYHPERGLPIRSTLYYAYQLMTARASGFDLKIRREATFFDATHQVKYRGIILNPYENYNTTVLNGRAPAPVQELGLSEQFARKQKINIGNVIKAGDALYSVAGLMTDAFSFVPSQDLLNPIPNPKVSAFAYGSELTLQAMMEGTKTNSSSKDSMSQNYTYFLWNQAHETTFQQDQRKILFLSSMQDQKQNLKNDFTNVKNYVKKQEYLVAGSGSEDSLKGFNNSNFRYSWTLEPLVFKIYSAITYTAAAIIALIAIIALVVCVRKTIDLNSKQIGILKALGESPAQISVAYISYSIIILGVIIPLAWISGIVLQIPFANMFLTYFSAQPYQILWDWISIVIAIFGLGLLSGIIAFVSAHRLTNRPVIKILGSSVKWSRSFFLNWVKTWNKKAKFSTRFSLTLASSGSTQIRLMVFVVLITSLLMTFGLAIPSVAMSTNNTYYKSTKYANGYTQVPLTANAPQSKNTISFWEGQDYLDSDYINGKVPLDTSGNTYGYYDNVENYSSTISNSSVVVPYLYDGTNVQSTYAYIIKNNTQLLSIISGLFGNNFYVDTGQGFSVGMIDKFFGTVLHSYSNINQSLDPTKNITWTDNYKILFAQNFSNWLTSSIPNIIGAIIGGTGAGDGRGDNTGGTGTWKDDVMNVIYKAIPSYVKAYVQRSISRQDQYAISYQNDLYAPGIDTYTTLVNGQASEKNITLTGLDKVQNGVVINQSAKEKAYLPQAVKQQVYDVLNNKATADIKYNNVQIYNKALNTLTLPMVINNQAAASYGLTNTKTLTDWTNNAQKINFLSTQGYKELPKQAWVYDDTDYVAISKTKVNDSQFYADVNSGRYETTLDGKYYLDPYTLDNNKFTLKVQYDLDNGSLRSSSYLFNDWKYDATTTRPIGSYIRPYYVFKDLKMMIPLNAIADVDNFLYPNGAQTKDGNPNNSWYDASFAATNVPASVKAAYAAQGFASDVLNGNWLVINPYDISYYDPEIYANSLNGAELTNLLIGPSYWYRWVTSGARPPLLMVRDRQTYLNPTVKINFQTVGKIESYNDKLIVIDSDLANTLLGYSTARTYQYNYQTFDQSTLIPANTRAKDNTISKFNRYNLLDLKPLIDSDATPNLWLPHSYKLVGDAFDYAPHMWYNAKFSNFDEPVNFTSQISFTRTDRWGQFSIKLGGSAGAEISIIASSQLLSESKALIKQVSMLAIAIGALLIAALIITASLLIMLTGDIYIAQYMRFMVLLKALGYSNFQIITYTFGTVTILSALAWIGGTIIGWGLIFIGVHILGTRGLALPVGITWWPIIISFVVMLISYLGSLWLSSHKARKESPSVILTETAE